MKTSTNETLYVCGCCKQELPQEAFYFNKRAQKPENYCKQCRRTNSNRHRDANRVIRDENKRLPYPVITQIEDTVLRNFLIQDALEKIAESIERKKQKTKLQESLWEE